jgi:hypothetical protein
VIKGRRFPKQKSEKKNKKENKTKTIQDKTRQEKGKRQDAHYPRIFPVWLRV